MSYFLQNLVFALSDGACIALIALGYTMVYGVLRLINFLAHGDVFMIGAYVGAYVAKFCSGGLDSQPWYVAVFGIVCSMIICGGVGFVIERLAYGLLRKSPKLSALITAIGVSLLIEYLAQIEWTPRQICNFCVIALASMVPFVINAITFRFDGKKFFLLCWLPVNGLLAIRVAYLVVAGIFRKDVSFSLAGQWVESWFGTSKFFGPNPLAFLKITGAGDQIKWFESALEIRVTWNYVIIVLVTLVTMIALYFVVQHTRMGCAMRAVSQNSDAARLMGVNTNSVISFTFVMGSMLAAVGGCLYSLDNPQCVPWMGVLPGLKAFVAAVIGGIGNLPGAALGGLVIALPEMFVKTVKLDGTAILNPYRDAIVFGVLILVLIVKPEGIFGKAVPEKV